MNKMFEKVINPTLLDIEQILPNISITTDLKHAWIKALRSGEYTQDNGYLKTKNGYCCLGVLCAIQGADFNNFPTLDTISMVDRNGKDWSNDIYGGEKDLLFLNLGRLNDLNHTFERIADVIEQIPTVEENGQRRIY